MMRTPARRLVPGLRTGVAERARALGQLSINDRLERRSVDAAPQPIDAATASRAKPWPRVSPPPAPAAPDDAPPSRLAADFDAVGALGRGGFGRVIAARHRLDGATYALKLQHAAETRGGAMAPSGARQPGSTARRATRARRASSPPRRPSAATSPRRSRRVHARAGRTSTSRPRNVFSDGRGTWRLGDFGLAARHDRAPAAASLDGAPERRLPGVAQRDARPSDVWGLGVVLFELLRVFPTTMERALALEHLRGGRPCEGPLARLVSRSSRGPGRAARGGRLRRRARGA
ncbi:protein kinase [Aureococcus anophagefferens]|nr:protein kinase [Aureococcus anophagefferens]